MTLSSIVAWRRFRSGAFPGAVFFARKPPKAPVFCGGYDVSCSSSGTVRRNAKGGVGICHSFAEDGRCVSLLKVMLTNFCVYDCAYCVNRRSNGIPRATLSVAELTDEAGRAARRRFARQ